MKRIDKNEKIWLPSDTEEDGYERLLEGDEYNEPVILELSKPIEISGAQVTELTINPPTADQMLRAQQGKGQMTARSTQYMAEICNVPLDAIRALSARDFNRIGLVSANFID